MLVLVLFLLGFGTLSFSCRIPTSPESKAAKVYVCGSAPTYFAEAAGFWATNGGTTTWIPCANPAGSAYEAHATGVTTDGSAIFVCGYTTNTANKQTPCYWVTSGGTTTWVSLANAVDTWYGISVTGIAVSGTTAYVSGYVKNSIGVQVAGYWVSSGSTTTWVPLPNPNGSFCNATGTGIATDGSNVYVSGIVNNSTGGHFPGFWASGVGTTTWVPCVGAVSPSGCASGITVSGSTVYVCGWSANGLGKGAAGYWAASDGTTTWVPFPSEVNPGYQAEVSGVAVDGLKVYVSGSTYSSQTTVAGYWVTESGTTTWVACDNPNGFSSYAKGSGIIVSGATVYMSGRVDALGFSYSGYWVTSGGTTTWIPCANALDSKLGARANGIAVSGSSVYVCGNDQAYSTIYTAGYWGVSGGTGRWVSCPLPAGTYTAYASGIAISDSTVYISGSATTSSGESVAGYWETNGDALTWIPCANPEGPSCNASAVGIAVEGSTVYVCGRVENSSGVAIAGYWVASGGTTTWVPCPSPAGSTFGSDATGFAVSESTVYVCGSAGDGSNYGLLGYWVTSSGTTTWVPLDWPEGCTSAHSPTGIAVAGATVYISGVVYYGSENVAGYWVVRDGTTTWVPCISPTGFPYAWSYGITVSESTVYVCGYARTDSVGAVNGFSASSGGTTTWVPCNNPFGSTFPVDVNKIAVDGSTVYISGRITGPGPNKTGYWVSNGGNATWVQFDAIPPDFIPAAIAVDPFAVE